MSIDLIFPFAILIILVIYFILTRQKFEKEMLEVYNDKFEQWKKHNKEERVIVSSKELIGLVYKDKKDLSIELFDEELKDIIKDAKFKIEVKK